MRIITFFLAVSMLGVFGGCSNSDQKDKTNAAVEKAKKDSVEKANLLKQAGEMNTMDSSKIKKDSSNKSK